MKRRHEPTTALVEARPTSLEKTSFVIVGRGKVGSGFAWSLESRKIPHVLVASTHRRAIARASLVILAVPDARIGEVAEHLAPFLPPSVPVAHCAGARSWQALAFLRERGHPVCQMHPLLSFAGKPVTMAGGALGIDGDVRAVRAATALARLLDMRAFSLTDVDPVQYHAAAALLANGTVALARAFQEVVTRAGLRPALASPLAAGLVRSVSENLKSLGLPAALTGPVRRGDADAVEAHLDELRRLPRAALAYRALLPLQLELAAEVGEASPASRRRVAALSRVTSKALKARKNPGKHRS